MEETSTTSNSLEDLKKLFQELVKNISIEKWNDLSKEMATALDLDIKNIKIIFTAILGAVVLVGTTLNAILIAADDLREKTEAEKIRSVVKMLREELNEMRELKKDLEGSIQKLEERQKNIEACQNVMVFITIAIFVVILAYIVYSYRYT